MTSTTDSPHSPEPLEAMLTEAASAQTAMNLLETSSTFKTISKPAVLANVATSFPGSEVVVMKFRIGERSDGGGFTALPGLLQLIVGELRRKGLDVQAEGIVVTLTLSEAKFRELAESDDGTSRSAVADALRKPDPDAEQQARIDALKTIPRGRTVANDSKFIIQSGTVKLASILDGRALVLQFSIRGNDDMDDQGGVVIDMTTGEVTFSKAETRCNEYLQQQSADRGGVVALADYWIKLLQAA